MRCDMIIMQQLLSVKISLCFSLLVKWIITISLHSGNSPTYSLV